MRGHSSPTAHLLGRKSQQTRMPECGSCQSPHSATVHERECQERSSRCFQTLPPSRAQTSRRVGAKAMPLIDCVHAPSCAVDMGWSRRGPSWRKRGFGPFEEGLDGPAVGPPGTIGQVLVLPKSQPRDSEFSAPLEGPDQPSMAAVQEPGRAVTELGENGLERDGVEANVLKLYARVAAIHHRKLCAIRLALLTNGVLKHSSNQCRF